MEKFFQLTKKKTPDVKREMPYCLSYSWRLNVKRPLPPALSCAQLCPLTLQLSVTYPKALSNSLSLSEESSNLIEL